MGLEPAAAKIRDALVVNVTGDRVSLHQPAGRDPSQSHVVIITAHTERCIELDIQEAIAIEAHAHKRSPASIL